MAVPRLTRETSGVDMRPIQRSRLSGHWCSTMTSFHKMYATMANTIPQKTSIWRPYLSIVDCFIVLSFVCLNLLFLFLRAATRRRRRRCSSVLCLSNNYFDTLYFHLLYRTVGVNVNDRGMRDYMRVVVKEWIRYNHHDGIKIYVVVSHNG